MIDAHVCEKKRFQMESFFGGGGDNRNRVFPVQQ